MPPAEHRILEVADLSSAVFESGDDGRMMATVRILRSGKSKNNRIYRARAIQEAVENKLFDGIRMFIDHDPHKIPLKRSLNQMVSAIESTSYDAKAEAMDARVEFFDAKFYEYAKRAQKYMGSSINALVKGDRYRTAAGVVEEDIHSITHPRSVDWVIYPAAGGEILAFEDEDEGDDVDWSALTLDELKKNAPHLVTEMETELKEAEPPEEKEKEKPDPKELLTFEAVEALVQERIDRYVTASTEENKKKKEVGEKVRETFKTSGLPEKTRARLIASFESMDSYDEEKVKAAIVEAKEELKAAGVGPRITGNGPSAGASGDKPEFSVKESVEAHFGMKGSTDSDASKEGAK